MLYYQNGVSGCKYRKLKERCQRIDDVENIYVQILIKQTYVTRHSPGIYKTHHMLVNLLCISICLILHSKDIIRELKGCFLKCSYIIVIRYRIVRSIINLDLNITTWACVLSA